MFVAPIASIAGKGRRCRRWTSAGWLPGHEFFSRKLIQRIPLLAFARYNRSAMTLPYLIENFDGIGGRIKQRPEDFFVQELPAYEPSGEGEHLFMEIEKVGLTTLGAINRLARTLRISPREIGYAGLKDSLAVCRQIFSIPRIRPDDVRNLKWNDLHIVWAMPHGNKLRPGHLAGNRFAIRIRDVNPTAIIRLRPILNQLAIHGMPNYFGSQRFGLRGNNHELGAALVRGDDSAVLNILLGAPDSDVDDPVIFQARTHFQNGQFSQALEAWPQHCQQERRALACYIQTQRPADAVRTIDRPVRKLWVSALQSHLFNEVCADRVRHHSLGQLLAGDLAMKHDNGACFKVQDPATEQPRADRFEISPTGPMPGYRMSWPDGEPARIEREILAAHNFTPDDFRGNQHIRARGQRRALRVKPADLDMSAGADEHGTHITLAFTLPPGSFATTLLREIMRNDDVESPQDIAEAPDDNQPSHQLIKP